MATDQSRLGNAIVNALIGAGLYPTDASPAAISKSVSEWSAIGGAILSELKTNMDIALSTGDIPVVPGSFSSPSGPVTGLGNNQSVTLSGKLK